MPVPMPLVRRALLLFVALAAFGAAAIARAADAPVSAADGAAIRQVIQSQMQAFAKDDGARAFGYASPTIQEIFRTADNFMAMVRSDYRPVYRPRRVEFGPVEEVDGEPVQHVWITGPDGQDVEALYTMQRQRDGSWRINGCDLRRANDA